MERKECVVAVDLGDSNVVVAVGSKLNDGTINIESIITRPSEGIKAGAIHNIALAGNAVKEAISSVESELNIKIHEVYVGLSGEFVYCSRHNDHVFVSDPVTGVKQSDVDVLYARMGNVQAAADESIMERIPQNYVVDETIEVKNPVGSFGRRLSSTFNFIISSNTPMQRIKMLFERQGIKVKQIFSNAVAVGDAVLTPDEKEEGVVVVDLGGGLTDIAVYYRNVVRYIATIPMGADAIDRDIRSMMIPDKYVESLKQRCGYAMASLAPEKQIARVKGRTHRETKEIPLFNLATVIEARATDIAEFVCGELKDSGFAGKLPYGIVLTGGSAQLRGIDSLFKKVTGLDVRVAEPEEVISEESCSKITSSANSTVVGLLIHGVNRGNCLVEQLQPQEEDGVEIVDNDNSQLSNNDLGSNKTDLGANENNRTSIDDELELERLRIKALQESKKAELEAERIRAEKERLEAEEERLAREKREAILRAYEEEERKRKEKEELQRLKDEQEARIKAQQETQEAEKTDVEEKVEEEEEPEQPSTSIRDFKGMFRDVVKKVNNAFKAEEEEEI